MSASLQEVVGSKTAKSAAWSEEKTSPELTPPSRRIAKVVESGERRNFVVLDGLNVIFASHFHPRLENLLAVFTDVASHGHDVACVFDANTSHKILAAQGPTYVSLYHHLLNQWDQHFIEVTGGTTADDIILPLADMRDGQVISNDKFTDYVGRFPWVTNSGRVVHINVFRDIALVGSHRIHMNNDADKYLSEIGELLDHQKAA